MPMPTITDLQGMYGDWNPQAYMQAQENAGLERQFRESQYGEQQAQTRQRELANMYSEQEQPGKMETQRLTNQNLGYTGTGQDIKNKEGALTLERNTAMQKYNLDAEQRKALMQITSDDIAMGEKQAQQMMMSMDPNIRKQGEQLYGFTKYARDEKTKFEREMEKVEAQRKSAEKIAGGNNATQIQLEKMRQAGQDNRAAARGPGGSSSTLAGLGKLSPDKRLGYVKAILGRGLDPDTGEPFTPAAQKYYEDMYAQDVATQNAKGPMAPQAPILDIKGGGLKEPAPRPSVDTRNQPKTAEGQTKSGVKFKVITE